MIRLNEQLSGFTNFATKFSEFAAARNQIVLRYSNLLKKEKQSFIDQVITNAENK